MNKQQGKATMNVLALSLTAVFALMCAALLLMAVQAYHAVTARTQAATECRTAVGYVMNRVHAAQEIRINTMELDAQARCVMILAEEIDGKAYETRLFCADGMLREQFCRSDIPLTGALDGAEIAQLESFEAQREDDLLTMRFVHADASNTVMRAVCAQEGSGR